MDVEMQVRISLEALVIGAVVGILVGYWTYNTIHSGGFAVLFGFIATGLVTWLVQKLFFNEDEEDEVP